HRAPLAVAFGLCAAVAFFAVAGGRNFSLHNKKKRRTHKPGRSMKGVVRRGLARRVVTGGLYIFRMIGAVRFLRDRLNKALLLRDSELLRALPASGGRQRTDDFRKP